MTLLTQIVLSILMVAGIVAVPLAQRELLRLERDHPDVLNGAGIAKIDWWWSCLRGIFRLGYLPAGRSLSAYTRATFRIVIFTYAWLIVVLLLIASGHFPEF